MILIDGKFVEDKELDPAKHRYIGVFRRPWSIPNVAGYIQCGCGQILQTQDQSYQHWQSGHWDTPQYVSIEEKK